LIRWTRFTWRLALVLALTVGVATPGYAAKPGNDRRRPGDHKRLDNTLNRRAERLSGTSRVIITLKPGWDASSEVKRLGGRLGKRLGVINGQVVELPNWVLRRLADHPAVQSIHYDRPTGGEMNRAAVTVGARAVQYLMGYSGAGVGVAVIDSGITPWHDDMTYFGSSSAVRTVGGQRVAKFVDFVNGQTTPYDDNGHGTHVSGTIAGNGYDTYGARAGIAPNAHIVSLKVLDQQGRGYISDVIAALDYAIANKSAFNIRVINLSVGAAVTESYMTDPLTLAAKRATDAGIVVVVAAGNLGKNRFGQVQYGGITAPGNAPWVLTVGASSHNGTVQRGDDKIALYSSRGPTAVNFESKPDLVAPGTGIVAMAARESLMYSTKASYLLNGTRWTSSKPYLSLSGTSMAAPVVAGTVALMMEANPSLTPNLVKAILQYTAQKYNYNALTQGAGFLNSQGAVSLARFYANAQAGSRLYVPRSWSREVIWGNQRLKGGQLRPNANAWNVSTTWGAAVEDDGDNIVWGTLCGDDCENIVWGTFDALDGENIVWGTLFGDDGENIVWGTFSDGENIVWGTLDEVENIVWGTSCDGADCENIVWGTTLQCAPLDLLCDNLHVYGKMDDVENIVWGTNGDIENIVWGTSSEDDNVTWGNSGEDTPLFDLPDAEPTNFDATVFEDLFGTTDTSGTTGGETPPSGSTPETDPVTDSVTDVLGGIL
jgi:serine protease AprX